MLTVPKIIQSKVLENPRPQTYYSSSTTKETINSHITSITGTTKETVNPQQPYQNFTGTTDSVIQHIKTETGTETSNMETGSEFTNVSIPTGVHFDPNMKNSFPRSENITLPDMSIQWNKHTATISQISVTTETHPIPAEINTNQMQTQQKSPVNIGAVSIQKKSSPPVCRGIQNDQDLPIERTQSMNNQQTNFAIPLSQIDVQPMSPVPTYPHTHSGEVSLQTRPTVRSPTLQENHYQDLKVPEAKICEPSRPVSENFATSPQNSKTIVDVKNADSVKPVNYSIPQSNTFVHKSSPPSAPETSDKRNLDHDHQECDTSNSKHMKFSANVKLEVQVPTDNSK